MNEKYKSWWVTTGYKKRKVFGYAKNVEKVSGQERKRFKKR